MRGVIRLMMAGDSFWLVSGNGVQVVQCKCPTEFGRGGNQVPRHLFRAFAKRSDPATPTGHPCRNQVTQLTFRGFAKHRATASLPLTICSSAVNSLLPYHDERILLRLATKGGVRRAGGGLPFHGALGEESILRR